MRSILRAVLVAVAFMSLVGVYAQSDRNLPLDPQVRVGHLDNGLTYYIRHNDYPKGLVDFFIAQKVGSMQEEDNQRGLAHFLEHMCFNGTRTFPGNEMLGYLEAQSVKFGQNINAYTSYDQTVYYISKVPADRKPLVDTCLVILRDWADGLLLDSAEIDKERGVIHSEWSARNSGSSRIVEKLMPELYPDSKYAYRSPIGIMEVVDNFPYQTLRDYYERWYRPDLQGIVVVGDIDVDSIEHRIRDIFGGVKMPDNPSPRVYYDVPDTPGTIYAIGKDAEQPNAVAYVMWKYPAESDSLKKTYGHAVRRYIDETAALMMNMRLSDMMTRPDTEFAMAQATGGTYLVSRPVDASQLIVVAKGNDILPGLRSAYREALRAERHGFTPSEYERVRSEFLSSIEQQYNNRSTITSTSLAEEYVENFLNSTPAPGIEFEYKLYTDIANSIDVETINRYMHKLRADSNRVVLMMLPDNASFTVPTKDQVAQALASVEAETIEPYADEQLAKPLIPQLPEPGKIVAETTSDLYGTTEWTLSNGAKVIVKTTDFRPDEIRFGASAIGGTSVLPDSFDIDIKYMPLAADQSGLGEFNKSQMSKYMLGKQANVDFVFNDYSRRFFGTTTPKDLPVLMELIYMNFTAFNITPDDFESARNIYVTLYENREAKPDVVFTNRFLKQIFPSPRKQSLDKEQVAAADRERVIRIVRDMTENAGDYTFAFVGNVDPAVLRPLVERYIASLPGHASAHEIPTYVNELAIPTGSSTVLDTLSMDTPQTYVGIIASAQMDVTPRTSMIASMAGQILSARLIKAVREDMGAVYSIRAQASARKFDKPNVILESTFPMKPEMRDSVLAVIAENIYDMSQNVSYDELGKVKEYMVKSLTERMHKNGLWLNAILQYADTGDESFNCGIELVESVTPQAIQMFMEELLKQNNYKVYVLDPAGKAAPQSGSEK